MIDRNAWLALFPLEQATAATDALVAGWNTLAAEYRTEFNHKTHEHRLTRALVTLLRQTSPGRGLMGYWGSEQEVGDIDIKTGRVTNLKRTDIHYHWNGESQRLELVYELKKLGDTSNSRRNYAKEGIARFVDGHYSRSEPIAFMVGILVAERSQCIAALVKALKRPAMMTALNVRRTPEGEITYSPSVLFPDHADFDTEHTRPPDRAPSHGSIRIAHLFVEFGYPLPGRSRQRQDVHNQLDSGSSGSSG